MALESGTRLGPFEILSELGSGGMGEVYLARDTRLDREVAIKVLPPQVATTPQARARFEREARAVSSLNHPHICTLHDVGREGDVDYLVMERLEGETLATRLTRGPLPIEEVLRLGIQIADALDRAHKNGLVHRDLKPGNVMLVKEGAKLLDFGLARAMMSDPEKDGLTVAATLTTPLTAEGSIVGTYQYMAPEQLEGGEVDARSDLWALGAMLYEAATGRRAFEGKTQASLIAAILERQTPSVVAAIPLAPPGLDQLIGACLAKDPADRIQTAHDVKLQLQWILEGGSQAGVPAPVAARRRSRERIAWALAVLGLAGSAALGSVMLLQPRPSPQVVRFDVRVPPGQREMTWPRVSPDGSVLAFQATDTTGVVRLWVRPLDSGEAQPLPGTEGAGRPFWSAHGRHLAFMADNKLKRVPATGGPTILVSDAPGRYDGSWGAGDVILLDGGPGDSLVAVPASGGVAKPASSLDRTRNETLHAWPFFLPDGKRFLFIARRNDPQDPHDHMKLGSLGSTEAFDLGPCDSRVEFAPPDQVLYVTDGTLVAQTIDLGKHRLTGDPVPITDEVVTTSSGLFAVSPAGVLVVGTGTEGGLSELVWTDRSGERQGHVGTPNRYRELALSPDARHAAVEIHDMRGDNNDVWVIDLERDVFSRLTFGSHNEVWPTWSPDGSRVVYAADPAGTFSLYSKAASGVGEEDSLVAAFTGNEGPSDWSADGKWIASVVVGTSASWDIAIRPADGTGDPEIFLGSPSTERDPTFSPDGRWIAYRSNETGRNEIYVRSFPDGQSKWQVSNSGGYDPTWTKGGSEIIYHGVDGSFMAVPVTAGAEFRSGTPVPLFRAALTTGGVIDRRWDVTEDGERFLLNQPVGEEGESLFSVTTHWTEMLRGR